MRYLKALGASQILRRQDIDLGKRPLEAAQWGGAIDNVGGEILTWLTRTVDNWGNIASIGLAASHKLETTVMPFILRGVSLLGINSSAMPRDVRLAVWKRLATDLKPRHLDKHRDADDRFRRTAGALSTATSRAASTDARSSRSPDVRADRLGRGWRRGSRSWASRSRRRRSRRSCARRRARGLEHALQPDRDHGPGGGRRQAPARLARGAALPPGPEVADVGSGAGFPGLPLAVADLERRFTLIESTGKKAQFVRACRREASSCRTWRSCKRGPGPGGPPAPFDSVIARALGSLADFIRVAGHLAGREGGCSP